MAVSIVTPLVAAGQPVLTSQDEFDPPTYRGMPWWFFKQVLLCIVPYVMVAKVLWDNLFSLLLSNNISIFKFFLDKFFAKTKLVRFFPIKQIFIILFNFINKN